MTEPQHQRGTFSRVSRCPDGARGDRRRCEMASAHGTDPARRPRPARRAALLLEVVLALTILVAAMGLLGAQLVSGLKLTRAAEEDLRASLLADRMLALIEMDPNLRQRLEESPEEYTNAIGDDCPGYSWRVRIEPVERENEELKVVTLEILREQDPASGSRTTAGAEVICRLACLKAEPAQIDLVEEAGLTEEMAEQLQQLVPISGFDPHKVDMQQLMTMLDPGLLTQVLPLIQPILAQLGFTGDLSQLAQRAGGQDLTGALQQVTGGAGDGNGMDPQQLVDAIRQAVGAQGTGGPGPGQRSETAPPPPPQEGGPGMMPVPGPRGAGPGSGPRNPENRRPPPPPGAPAPPQIGRGSGPNGEYTIDDLLRMRDEYARQQPPEDTPPE